MSKLNYGCIFYPIIWILKKSKYLSALSCRLVKLTGKSQYAIHPKHLINQKGLWYQNEIGKNDIVLDIGCGNGIQTVAIASHCQYIIGIDNNSYQLNIGVSMAKNKHIKNIFFKKIHILGQLPFKKYYFDKILCLDVLEHLNNRDLFLLEIKRVLKPNGIVFISVPNKNTSWKKLQRKYGLNSFSDPDHKIEYSAAEIARELNSAGFRIISIKPIVFDTPWTGFIDLAGAFSLRLYDHLDRWKRSRVKYCMKESIGFRIKAVCDD